MVRRQGDLLRPQVRRGPLRVGEGPAGGVRQQPGRPGVVGVDHAHAAVLEQDRLGVAVGLHGLVEIQVVLGQVREDAHGVGNPVHPVQHQGVGGDLHHHMGAARLPHLGQQGLQVPGLRRGPLRGDHGIADHVLVRADEAHLGPQHLLQHRLQEIRGGGLAVGAGDADHGHVLRRVAVEVGPQHRQGPAGVRHLDVGEVPLRRRLAHHRGGAALRRLANEGVAVRRKAPHGHEQVPGPDGPGVVADAGHLAVQVRCGGQNLDAPQKFSQFHSYRSSLRFRHLVIQEYYRQPQRKGILENVPKTGGKHG